MSQEVLSKTEKGTVKQQDIKNLNKLTKTIIDRFFNPSEPNAKVSRLRVLIFSHIMLTTENLFFNIYS